MDGKLNIEKDEYIQSLEKRIEKLENILEHLCLQQCKEISMANCAIGDIRLGDNCNITLNACSVGAMIPYIDDAEDRLDELESRLDDVMAHLDDVETLARNHVVLHHGDCLKMQDLSAHQKKMS